MVAAYLFRVSCAIRFLPYGEGVSFYIKWEADAVERMLKDARRDMRRDIERQLGGVRCPEHGTAPDLRFREVGGEWIWEVENPCCEKLADAVAGATQRIH